MVSPEGTGQEKKNQRLGRTAVIGVGLAVLAVGAIAMGGLTSPSAEVAAPETTTSTMVERLDSPLDLENFTVEQIERGAPLQWEVPITVTEGGPLAIVDHEGWTYVFATQQPNFSGNHRGGLWVWRSLDGSEWENLGQVLGHEHIVGNVTLTEQGIVTLTAGTGGADPIMWMSDDGIEWTPETIPVGASGPHTFVQPSAVGGTEGLMVVATDTGTDAYFTLAEHLTEAYPEIDATRFGWGTDIGPDGDITFKLWGPLGFAIAEVTGEEIGLTPEEEGQIAGTYLHDEADTSVWVKNADSEWVRGEIQGPHWIESITPLPDGQILASGFGSNGPMGWISPDGLNWESLGYLARPSHIERWNDSFVGPSSTGQAQVLVSNDGVEWAQLGPYEHFPFPIQWNLDQMAAGPAGIAAFVTGWEPGNNAFPQEDRLNPPVLRSGDADLTLDFWSGTLSLETPAFTGTYSMSGDPIPDGIEVDLESGLIVFVDPETDARLVAFTFDEIAAAQDEYWSRGFGSEGSHRAFVFTRDGEEWTIDEIGGLLGDRVIIDLEVTEGRIIAVVIDGAGRFDPTASPGFEVWSAPIP